MEYRIVLTRMEFHALHGCYELERKVGNRFTVDLEITACLGDAAESRSTPSSGWRRTSSRQFTPPSRRCGT